MKTLKISAVVLSLVCLCGCTQNRLFSNYRELDQTELIQTMGMDRSGDEVSVTVATGVMPDGAFTVFTGKAASVAKALSAIHTYPTKKFLFFGHTNNILIGSEMLDNMTDCLDFIERSVDLRLDTPFFIVRDTTARQLIREAQIGDARVTELLHPLTDESNLGSDNHVFTTKEIISVMNSEGHALAYAIQLTKDEDKVSTGSANIIPAGYGIIKEGRVIGFLEEDVCPAVNLILNQSVNGIFEIADPSFGLVSLSFSNSNCSVKGQFGAENKLEGAKISIRISANIEQLSTDTDIGNEDIREQIQKALEKEVHRTCLEAIKLSRSYKTDFLGLGRQIRVKNPMKWESVDNFEALLPHLPIQIEVDALIQRTYDIVQTGGVK